MTARALGVATQADLTEYHRLSLTQTRLMTDAVLAAGLTPVVIVGLSGKLRGSGTVPGWADPAALATRPPGAAGATGSRCSPRSTRWSGTASAPGGCSASTHG